MKKKMIITVLSLAVMLAFSGCSGKGSGKENNNTEKNAGAAGENTDIADKKDSDGDNGDSTVDAQDEADAQGKSDVHQDKADASTGNQELLAISEAFVKDLVEGSGDNIKTDYEYTEQMKSAVESGQILTAFQDTLKAVGEVKEIRSAWELSLIHI